MGATGGHGCDVFDGRSVGVVLGSGDPFEIHGYSAVAALIAEPSPERYIGDAFHLSGCSEFVPACVVNVGCQGDPFCSVPFVPGHVLLPYVGDVPGKSFSGSEHLSFLVCRVPGFHFGRAAPFAFTASAGGCFFVHVVLGKGLSGTAVRAGASAIGVVNYCHVFILTWGSDSDRQ